MRHSRLILALGAAFAAQPAAAQLLPTASIGEMANTPLVRVSISETLRTPPDEASLTVGTQAKAATATAAVAANKEKIERLLATIRAQGIRERDIQTQGYQLSPDYRYDREPNGSGRQRLIGYVASNSVVIKTRDISALTKLLDALTTAGADTVYGPNFAIGDPAPLRREARVRALQRGEAEALEYARNQGFARVRLLSVEEGTSYRGTDVIVVTGAQVRNISAPPPPPPAIAESGGGVVAPGQLETGVALNLLYRMER
ncbi:SIMPL domain-containing protein [Sphingomonas mesophila]|uniref:SIMPL domain-containing protein n=1 Tax=Sphingomonas mesophila TaxID=2303576 RepID=UPI0013C34AE0|nr:SIMPL domain-containing protein [Sphingomonas mesophila]